MYLVCRCCGAPISTEVEALEEGFVPDEGDQRPFVPKGRALFERKPEFSPYAEGWALNLKDLKDTWPHPDPARRNGCCDDDGLDGDNVVCANGHPVGVRKADCWMPHAFFANPEATRVEG